jgi:glutamyl/glutaminyl-tRNA synthetase
MINSNNYKTCPQCGKIFYKQNETLHNWNEKAYCTRECKIKARKSRYKKSEIGKEAQKRYRESEEGKETIRRYHISAKNKEYNKLYRTTEKSKESFKRWIKSEKGEIWKEKNHIIRLMRTRIYKALKGYGIKKTTRTIDFVGCSIEQLKEWLASQFKPGMTWDNYGKWHIDHIIPCAAFDLRCPLQRKICFWYRNLQPLWAEDNLIKSANYAVT